MFFHIEIKNLILKRDRFCLEVPHLQVVFPFLLIIQGPSGSGKSSLLRALIGIESTNPEFEWYLNGQPMHQLPLEQRGLGVVFQGLVLFPHMTAYHNIVFAQKKDDPQVVQRLVTDLGLTQCQHTLAAQLSGGERQRTAIAQVLAAEPRLVLLDEPFVGLDVAIKQQTRKAIFSVLKERKVPVVLITHDPSEYVGYPHSVVMVNEGQVRWAPE